MARKSAASLSVARPADIGGAPSPPADLGDAERAMWREIVDSKPSDWFGPDSLPVLKEYVRAAVTCDQLARIVGQAMDGDDGLKLKSALDMRDKEARRAASLATKLRLTQQSRYGARSADRADRRASGPRPWQTAS